MSASSRSSPTRATTPSFWTSPTCTARSPAFSPAARRTPGCEEGVSQDWGTLSPRPPARGQVPWTPQTGFGGRGRNEVSPTSVLRPLPPKPNGWVPRARPWRGSRGQRPLAFRGTHPMNEVRFVAKNMRVDLALIAEMIEPGTRVLDIGCGDGTLIDHLFTTKGC